MTSAKKDFFPTSGQKKKTFDIWYMIFQIINIIALFGLVIRNSCNQHFNSFFRDLQAPRGIGDSQGLVDQW